MNFIAALDQLLQQHRNAETALPMEKKSVNTI